MLNFLPAPAAVSDSGFSLCATRDVEKHGMALVEPSDISKNRSNFDAQDKNPESDALHPYDSIGTCTFVQGEHGI
jgi:hypothetical protein